MDRARIEQQNQIIIANDSNLKAANEAIKTLEKKIADADAEHKATKSRIENEARNKESQLRREIEDTNEISTRMKEESIWLKSQLGETMKLLDATTQERNDTEKARAACESRLLGEQSNLSLKTKIIDELELTLQKTKDSNKELENKFNVEKASREKLAQQQMDQESMLGGEIEKRAMIELEASNQANRASKLTRECQELKQKLEKTLESLAIAQQASTSKELSDTAPDYSRPPEPHTASSDTHQHNTVRSEILPSVTHPSNPPSPAHHVTAEPVPAPSPQTTTPVANSATQGGWASKFSLSFGNKSK